MIEIVPAHTGEALEAVIALSHDYVTWMISEIRRHYPQLDLNEFTSEHEYDNIRKKFPGEHVPPNGCLLVAQQNGSACGCVGLARLSATICEMRTLYVQPACRGSGIGKRLAEACLNEARHMGYRVIRLDTLGFMTGAQHLYHSMGFNDIEAYLDMSDSLKQYIHFMELTL